MNNRLLRPVIAVVLATLVLTLPVTAQDTAPSGEITYIHHFTSETEFEGMERVMEAFQEEYPDVTLVQENIPNADFMSKFTTAVVSDTRSDTTMVAAERFQDMIAMGGLVPITEYVNNWDLKDAYPASAWDDVTFEGEIYGVPAFAFVDWMYYRADWFEEAGLEVPTTCEEFAEAAVALTNADENRYGFGMRGGDGGAGNIMGVLQSFGALSVVDDEVVVDEAKFTEAIQWYADLYTVDHVAPPSVTGDSYRQIMEGFKTGQTAMVWHHTGSLAEISGALEPEQFGTALRPDCGGGPVGNISFLYNGIMSDENMDASWAWISFWGENAPAIAFLESTGYFPANSVVAEDPALGANPLYTAAFEGLANNAPPLQFVGASGWTTGVLLPEFQSILIGDKTVDEAVAAMLAGLEEATAS
jgi:multiple sugar transport system substrate-binding protein